MITVEVKLADSAKKLQELIASKLNVSMEKYVLFAFIKYCMLKHNKF